MKKFDLLALAVRISIAVSTRTVFQPDEYFQSLEPAFHVVFGYGHLTWEWLANKPIRSIVYPGLNIPVYQLLKVTGLANVPWLGDKLLILFPRVLHGILAAVTDIWLCELARVTLGNDYISTALFLSLSSFFHALALSRSLSNSLETSLSTVAYAYYPWDASSKLSPQLIYNRQRLRKTFVFSALACMIRPTNAVIWVFLYLRLLWSLRRSMRLVTRIALDLMLVGFTALTTLFVVDSIYYAQPIFTPLNFLTTNLSSVSLFYGSNSWHYYLTQGLPILCTTTLPFTIHGIYKTVSRKKSHDTALKNMLFVIMWSLCIYSLAGHKEWRFLHPILPLLHIFATKSLVDLSPNNKIVQTKPKSKVKIKIEKRPNSTAFKNLFPPIPTPYIAFLLITLPISIYVVLFYCSAPLSVISYLHTLPINATTTTTTSSKPQPQSVGFLMPCHSTPGQAYLHRPTWEVWSLGCEPPLQGQNLSTYQDQTGIFFSSPLTYISKTFPDKVDPQFPPSKYPSSVPGTSPLVSEKDRDLLYPWQHNWPRHLVFFGALLERPGFGEILQKKGYIETWKKGRQWEGEGERKGGVHVWSWR